MSSDNVHRLLLDDLNMRAYAVDVTRLAQDICGIHNTTPNATVALGRTLAATALLAATLKPESNQNVRLRFHGNGPLREVQAQADARGNMRGYVAVPDVDLKATPERISFSDMIGAAILSVHRDLGLREPYRSESAVIYGEIALDVAYYLTISEQIPSAVVLGLKLDANGGIAAAGGLLVQTFPDTEPGIIEKVDETIRNQQESFGDALAGGTALLDLVPRFTGSREIRLLSSNPLQHRCRCDRDLLAGVLANLDAAELNDMIEKDHGAEAYCSFCGKIYTFTEDDLRNMLNRHG